MPNIFHLTLLFLTVIFFPIFAVASEHDLLFNDLLNDAVDKYCLHQSYPEIINLEKNSQGEWLVFADGQRVLYRSAETNLNPATAYDTDIYTSMLQIYPLEPVRPPTPEGFAPGRKRSYALLRQLYGADQKTIKQQLQTVVLLGQKISLAKQPAEALIKVAQELENFVHLDPTLRRWLHNDGGFFWRKIAGENRLSPHSFGIALDLSANLATYWRWSKVNPHPLQQSYPNSIVSAFETHGFIWGGKWHEFDMMHFEYRPELICKARLLQNTPFSKKEF